MRIESLKPFAENYFGALKASSEGCRYPSCPSPRNTCPQRQVREASNGCQFSNRVKDWLDGLRCKNGLNCGFQPKLPSCDRQAYPPQSVLPRLENQRAKIERTLRSPTRCNPVAFVSTACAAALSSLQRRRWSMKWNMIFGALVVSVGLCTQSFGFELLDRLLGYGGGGGSCGGCCNSCCEASCCAAPSCCAEASCCAAETSCCAAAPSCAAETSCCAAEASCCEQPACNSCCNSGCGGCKKSCGLFGGLHGLFGGCHKGCGSSCCGSSCCEQSCCAAAPSCAAETSCCAAAPSCAAETSCCAAAPTCCEQPACNSCCNSGCGGCHKRKCCGLFSGLFSCKKSCCNSCNSCCQPTCGENNGCCNGCGGGAPAAADGGSDVPPAPPMSDSSASLRGKRRVVQTSSVARRN